MSIPPDWSRITGIEPASFGLGSRGFTIRLYPHVRLLYTHTRGLSRGFAAKKRVSAAFEGAADRA